MRSLIGSRGSSGSRCKRYSKGPKMLRGRGMLWFKRLKRVRGSRNSKLSRSKMICKQSKKNGIDV
jgi:hypothetical protein